MRFTQADLSFTGHAIEARVNAEDPAQNFRPHPGRIETWSAPELAGIRVDTHCFSGYLVPPFYDSMIAKVIAHAPTRDEALAKLDQALRNLTVRGIVTNVPFVRELLSDPRFQSDGFNTALVERRILEKEKQAA